MANASENNRCTLKEIVRRAGLSLDDGRRFLKAVLDELKLGREVRLEGFAIFGVTRNQERILVSPAIPGGGAVVPKSKVIRFRRSTVATDYINGRRKAWPGRMKAGSV